MRGRAWLLIVLAVAVGALAIWAPSRLAERQVAAVLRPYIEPTGSLSVKARTTALAYPFGRINQLDVDARGIRLGELTAERLGASLGGVTLVRSPDGRLVMRPRTGGIGVVIGRGDLERFLRGRGVQNPTVTIDATGVTAAGVVRAGAVEVTARVSGQFVASGRELRFRVTSVDVGGVELPPAMRGTIFGLIQPAVSLDALPFPVAIDSISTSGGSVYVNARIERPAP